RRFEDSFHKFHLINSVFDSRYQQRIRIWRTLLDFCGDLFREIRIELRERFQISFRMPARNTRGVCCRGSCAGTPAHEDSASLPERREDEGVWIFLPPIDSGFFAVNAQMEIVFVSGCNLGCPEAPLRSFRKTQHDVDVIVQPPAGNERRDIGCNLLNWKSSDEAGEVKCVRADIAQ